MSEIAFLSRPNLIPGAAQSGLRAAAAEDPSTAEELIMEFARADVSVIIVTEDLVRGRVGALREKIALLNGAAALIVVPVEERSEHLEDLRGRFAAALGVDVWETASRRGGVG